MVYIADLLEPCLQLDITLPNLATCSVAYHDTCASGDSNFNLRNTVLAGGSAVSSCSLCEPGTYLTGTSKESKRSLYVCMLFLAMGACKYQTVVVSLVD